LRSVLFPEINKPSFIFDTSIPCCKMSTKCMWCSMGLNDALSWIHNELLGSLNGVMSLWIDRLFSH
jgi:hypothetical protein